MTFPSSLFIIAGGSGSGKTTLAFTLAARHPDWTVVHLDNYRKPTNQVPMLGRKRNWDHPDALDFRTLLLHLNALMAGKPVYTKGRDQTKQSVHLKPLLLKPAPVILLEGYLALWHPKVRDMAAYKLFLEAPESLCLDRRRWKKGAEYVANVLQPMFRQHVAPTRAHAQMVLYTDADSPERLADIFEQLHVPGL